MPHPLGELALLVPPAREACQPAELAELEQALRARGVETRRVSLQGNADDIVRRELKDGARFVALCGSQRALTTIGPALVESGVDVTLGLFPGSTQNDFACSFGLRAKPVPAAAFLAREGTEMLVDVGVVTTVGRDGTVARRYLFNDAVVGLGAVAATRGERLRRLGRFGGLLGWWSALATYRPRHLDVDMVFAEWHDRATQVRLANGQYAHNGLHISPVALPDDGVWDIQVWDGPRHLPFTLQPKMLLTDHLPHPHISMWRQKRVEVTAPRPVPVVVDDRPAGVTPATFELLPKALRLKI
jgi:diacylglycerol kinase (ATP)